MTNGDISLVDIRDNGLSNVLELSALDTTGLWWGNIEGATGYDIVKGNLNELRARAGDFSDPLVTEICLADDQPTTFLQDPAVPGVGQSIFYILRSQPGGTFDSGGTAQLAPRDAAIG